MRVTSPSPTPATPPRPLPLWQLLGLAIVSGLLLFASCPPLDLGPLAFVAVVPLFVGLLRCRRPHLGALAGLVCGLVFFGLLLNYIRMFGLLPWLALTIFQALFIAVAGCLIALLAAARLSLLTILGTAAAWTLAEFLRGHVGPVSFTFGQLCYTQHDVPAVLQVAGVFGPQAVTFVVVLAGAGLAAAVLAGADRRLRAKLVVQSYGLVLLVYLSGGLTINAVKHQVQSSTARSSFTVSAIQGNVPIGLHPTQADVERCRRTYVRMTEGLLPGSDLVVWPESALPVFLNRAPDYLGSVAHLAEQVATHLLVGALEQDSEGRVYNTAYLFAPDGRIVDRYRKVDLVPFGEYVPGRDKFNFLQRYPIRPFDFTPGRSRNLLHVKGQPLGVLICFEGIFAAPTRQLCRKGATILVLITSDAWADNRAEVLQHSTIATLRAVEARRYVVRAATMGRSAIIAPWGEVVAEVPAFTSGVADATIQPLSGLSLYHRWGPGPLVVLLCAFWMLARLNIVRRQVLSTGGEHDETFGD